MLQAVIEWLLPLLLLLLLLGWYTIALHNQPQASHRLSQWTELNAFAKSAKWAYNVDCHSIDCSIIFLSTKVCSAVLLLHLNPACSIFSFESTPLRILPSQFAVSPCFLQSHLERLFQLCFLSHYRTSSWFCFLQH